MKRPLIILCLIVILTGCAGNDTVRKTGSENKYGVFLGLSDDEVRDRTAGYELIVIDGQDITKETVAELKDEGHTVYGYLSIGSLEKFRPYYPDFSVKTLGEYENWPDEYWIDVSDRDWQSFVINDPAKEVADKGFDGFFLDNADIFYHYPDEGIYHGLISILEGIKAYGLPVMINGGDTFVTRLIADGRTDLIDAVNQETVLSRIVDYDNDIFEAQDPEETRYFTGYLERVKKAGIDVYLLEYTTDEALTGDITAFCDKNGYGYYISEHVDLK